MLAGGGGGEELPTATISHPHCRPHRRHCHPGRSRRRGGNTGGTGGTGGSNSSVGVATIVPGAVRAVRAVVITAATRAAERQALFPARRTCVTSLRPLGKQVLLSQWVSVDSGLAVATAPDAHP